MGYTIEYLIEEALNGPEEEAKAPEPVYRVLTYKSGNGRKNEKPHIVWAVVDIVNGLRVSPEYGAIALKTTLYALKSGARHRRRHGSVEISEYTRNAVIDEWKRLERGGKPQVRVSLSQKALRQMRLMTYYFIKKHR